MAKRKPITRREFDAMKRRQERLDERFAELLGRNDRFRSYIWSQTSRIAKLRDNLDSFEGKALEYRRTQDGRLNHYQFRLLELQRDLGVMSKLIWDLIKKMRAERGIGDEVKDMRDAVAQVLQ